MSDTTPPHTPPHSPDEPAAAVETVPEAVTPPAPRDPDPDPERHPTRSRSAVPVLGAIGFLLLAAAIAYVWQDETSRQSGVDPAAFADMQSQVRSLGQRVASPDPRLAALDQRLTALENKPAPPPPPAPPKVDLGPLEARIAALEKRPQNPPPDPELPQRVADLQKQLDAAQQGLTRAQQGLEQTRQTLTQTEQQNARIGERATRLALVQTAQAALAAGEPLGDLPGAPPAISRFGRTRPPTEAALRLAFPDAAARAVAASKPSTEGETIGQRMWQNARALVTIRQGDRVLVGPPAAETLGQARDRLDAGDLAGAVAALGSLDGPAAQAMADWRDQAQALLDARAALAGMARG